LLADEESKEGEEEETDQTLQPYANKSGVRVKNTEDYERRGESEQVAADGYSSALFASHCEE